MATKFEYNKVIQGNYGQGYEDLSCYPCNSRGDMKKEDRELLRHDLKEYQYAGGGAIRVIFRREKRQ